MTEDITWGIACSKMDEYRIGTALNKFKGVTHNFYVTDREDAYRLIVQIETMVSPDSYRIKTYMNRSWDLKADKPPYFKWRVTVKASKDLLNLIRLTA